MGRIDKGVKCSVAGCSQDAVRSVSSEKARSAGLHLKTSGRRAYLCREHYRELKKRMRKERRAELWRYKS